MSRRHGLWLSFAALLLCAAPALAQKEPPAPAPVPASDVVKSGVLSGKVVLAPRAKPPVPGGLVTVNVVLEIESGWHIYANPAVDESARPTVVGIDPKAPVKVIGIDYPAGNPMPAAEGALPVMIYEPNVTIPLRLQLKDDVAPGQLVLPITVKFQPCDDKACLAPATLKLNAKLEVQKR